MSTECETCAGSGHIEHGEFGGDCAAIHGMGGRMPEAPGRSICDDCGGTGRIPATHTKGPWKAERWVDRESEFGGWEFSAGGYSLPLSDLEADDPEEAEANARLMAAAPELLEALQPFTARNNSGEFITITVRTSDVARARAVITKATGGNA